MTFRGRVDKEAQHNPARTAALALAMLSCLAFHKLRADEFIQVDAFKLPKYSDYLSVETRAGMERWAALWARSTSLCDLTTKSTSEQIRGCEALIYGPILAEARKRYDVQIVERTIAGIRTEIVTPTKGVAATQTRRILINVHGGGFKSGYFLGQLEAMPIATIGGYKVVTVDYRMAPEHRFPDASVDVAAVYRELLREFGASSIGLYGCSAGGRIVGQTVAWMSQQKLPKPGAIAILCSPPTRFGGDSNVIAAAVQGHQPRIRAPEGYFEGVAPTDPIAFPGDSDAMLAQFPPSLLMTSVRDYSLSPMVRMHARLVALGANTELHIFEGLGHGEYIYNPYIPEAREAARVIASFFDAHLGRPRPR